MSSVVEPLKFEYKGQQIEYSFDEHHSVSVGDQFLDVDRKITVGVVDIKLIVSGDRVQKKIYLSIIGADDDDRHDGDSSDQVRAADWSGGDIDEHVLYVSE